MKYNIDYLTERDTDFAIINLFSDYNEVRYVFCNRVGRKNAKLVEVYHSLTRPENGQGSGESDIVFILEDEQGKFGLFVENKITAQPQENQRARYDIRAKQMVNDGEFDEYYVYLCAPKAYLESSFAEGYENTVSYETIVGLVDECLDQHLLEEAAKRKPGDVIKVSNEATDFWNKLYAYVYQHHASLKMVKGLRAKSVNSAWPNFKSGLKNCNIVMKTNRGVVDLELPGMGNRLPEVEQLLKDLGIDCNVESATGSAALRKTISPEDSLDITKDFNSQISKIEHWLIAIDQLKQISDRIALKVDSFPLK